MDKTKEENRALTSLVGQWRLLSFDIENQESGHKSPGFGPNPKGRLVILPGAFIAILTAAGRAAPRTDEDRSAAFKQTIAYSGPFEIEGEFIKVRVDVTANEAWGNTVQVRTFKVLDSRLHLVSAWAPSPIDPNTIVRGILEWEREESH